MRAAKRAQAASATARPLRSALFNDDENVFARYPDQIVGARVCRFDERQWDALGIVPRRANQRHSQLRITFPDHPTWSLRSREVAMALLNTSDPRLLSRSIAFGSRWFKIGMVRSRCECYKIAATWQVMNDLPDDISTWTPRHWTAMVEHEIDKGSKNGSVRNLVTAIRDLVALAPILTGGGIGFDPWNGRRAVEIAEDAEKGKTEVIAPQQWIPLIAACWHYIDVFAEDVLSLRETHRCARRGKAREKDHRQLIDFSELLDGFLRSKDATIPMRHNVSGEPVPNWTQVSRLVTANLSEGAFKSDAVGQRRRTAVLDAIADRRVPSRALSADEFDTALQKRISANPIPEGAELTRRATEADTDIEEWIARPDSRVAVLNSDVHPPDITECDINWSMMERIVFGAELQNQLLNSRGYPRVVARRQRLVDVARSGRIFVASDGLLSTRRLCVGFREVECADGQHRPWREAMSDFEARCELRALRAACYVFIAAMTMMRDSEIQDLKRGCIRSHYGVMAVKSNIYKGRPIKEPATWWIIDEVATTIGVLERLSVHPDYLFASFVDGDLENSEPGFTAGAEIAFLLEHLAQTGDRGGLAPVPDRPTISPRALRLTTACISRELGGNELAMGHQLKHAIDYGFSNVTSQYMAPDPEWANLLNTNRSEENLEHMVAMLRESAQSDQQLAGRGGQRLNQAMLNTSNAQADAGQRATLLSDAELASLLKKLAPDVHFGPANACLFDEATALCRMNANPDVTGPLLGLCQPAQCPNSVVGVEHVPVWLSELDVLKKTIAGPRVSPPRRQALSARIADVEQVLAQARPDEQRLR